MKFFILPLKFLNLLTLVISLSASDNSIIWIPMCLFLLPLVSAFIQVLFSLIPGYIYVNIGHSILKILGRMWDLGFPYLLLERIYFYVVYGDRLWALAITNQFRILEIKMIQRGASVLLSTVLLPFYDTYSFGKHFTVQQNPCSFYGSPFLLAVVEWQLLSPH